MRKQIIDILEQIHDEADHIIGTEADNQVIVIHQDAREIKRLVKRAMRIANMKPLTGQALADAYAKGHPLSEENPGKVWAHYEGGGWIVLRGEGLKPHPDLAKETPNGWGLLHRVRSGKARSELETNFKRLRKHYADCGSFA